LDRHLLPAFESFSTLPAASPEIGLPNPNFAYFQFIAGLVFYPEYSTSPSTAKPFLQSTQIQPTYLRTVPPSIVPISTTMDCFGDFCLACDKQTNGTPFCSQACRLAELDHSLSSSEPASPVYTRHGTSQRSPGLVTTGFQLPPAIDFLSYRRDRALQSSRGQAKSATAASHSINEASTSTAFPRSANLTPSSSQTSLSSLRTNQSSPGGISEQAWNELRNYASGFDQVRALKRRMSTL
jgi:ECL1/2/3 zinc binding proteins